MKKFLWALSFVSCVAHAEFKDGNNLYEDIGSNNYFTQGVALGYIMAVTDALRGIVHCVSENATAGQLHDMVKQYLEENPSSRHLPADVIISRVLARTWPCPKKGGAL